MARQKISHKTTANKSNKYLMFWDLPAKDTIYTRMVHLGSVLDLLSLVTKIKVPGQNTIENKLLIYDNYQINYTLNKLSRIYGCISHNCLSSYPGS